MTTIAKKITLAISILFLATALTGCAGRPGDPFAIKTGHKGQAWGIGGAGAGAIIGQAIGHDTGSTLIGTVIGGTLGYIVGNEMDKYDRQQLGQVFEQGRSGVAKTWKNPDKPGIRQVTPQPAYADPNGNPCRQAEIATIIDGNKQKVFATACRDAYGNWQLQ